MADKRLEQLEKEAREEARSERIQNGWPPEQDKGLGNKGRADGKPPAQDNAPDGPGVRGDPP
jgi:hypothetical protein